MARYPAQPLEEKLTWMRKRQREKEAQAKAEVKVAVPEQPPAPVPAPERPSRQMLHVNEVAGILQMSVRTVRRWFRDRAVVVRGHRRTTMLISEQILDDWIAEHTGSPKRQGRR